MNPLYQMLNGGLGMTQAQRVPMNNPAQIISAAMQAMSNPAQFIRQQFPDVPNEISNDPNRILAYLQQTRGITNPQLQQIMQTYPMR